jgi:hypothetical protein
LATFPGVRLRERFPVERGRPDLLYEVLIHPRPGCAERLFPVAAFTDGAPPPPDALRGRLEVRGLVEPLPQLGEVRAYVTLENDGTQPWLGVSVDERRRVTLAARWVDPATGKVGPSDEIFLPADVEPGRSHAFPTWLRVPGRAGVWALRVSAVQGRAVNRPGTVAWEQRFQVGPKP